MDIKTLEGRIWFLAGQLEEAKKIYQDALGEINRTNNAVTPKERVDVPISTPVI